VFNRDMALPAVLAVACTDTLPCLHLPTIAFCLDFGCMWRAGAAGGGDVGVPASLS